MNPHASAILLGVKDLDRAKKFYGEGLGWPIQMDQGGFVSFKTADGSSTLALYEWGALAADGGVDPKGSGFQGIAFSHIVRSDERVDEVLAEAERAGGKIVNPAKRAEWGGYGGYFADPDGHLWKINSASGEGHKYSE
jgi:uncharacterized protein